MKPIEDLTELQLRVLDVLWDRGESSTRDVSAALEDYARTTVGTLLTRLVQYGVVASRREGRERLFRPLVERRHRPQ